ncbi:hypothetical protein [Streptomyces fagopyri]|uniref:hypothetical protein n=1 Tax=Streptomyces fagopyri TaxID=2662397 RepID=UPI0037103442
MAIPETCDEAGASTGGMGFIRAHTRATRTDNRTHRTDTAVCRERISGSVSGYQRYGYQRYVKI